MSGIRNAPSASTHPLLASQDPEGDPDPTAIPGAIRSELALGHGSSEPTRVRSVPPPGSTSPDARVWRQLHRPYRNAITQQSYVDEVKR